MEDARRAVKDVLELLNRHFRGRGVEFVSAGEGSGDWTIALYWKDFGGMGWEEFEKVYEGFRKEKKPVIHVFFKEPDAGIGEALKAFKDAFAEKYGHFYCHFETVDAVRFQLVSQGLWLLPGTGAPGERDALKVEDGVVRLGNEPVAKMENLSFARLNKRRKSLLQKISDARKRLAVLEEDPATANDEETMELVRDESEELHNLHVELQKHDALLIGAAVFFAKESAQEMDERVVKARELFMQGKVHAANQLLELGELTESANRNLSAFEAQRESCEKNIQAFLAKTEMVMADDSLPMASRVDEACKAFDEAIRVARAIRWDEARIAAVQTAYVQFLYRQNRFSEAVPLCTETLESWKRLARKTPEVYTESVAWEWGTLANVHRHLQMPEESEREYSEASKCFRRLAKADPVRGQNGLASVLFNSAKLHCAVQPEKAETALKKAIKLWRLLAEEKPQQYASLVAGGLNNLAKLHFDGRQTAKAEKELLAGLEILRCNGSGNSLEHGQELARILNHLAVLHWNEERFEEAECEYAEALEIGKRLMEESPRDYEVLVAKSLNGLGGVHVAMKRLPEAEAEYEAAQKIRRRLAARNPVAYGPALARTLNGLASIHSSTRRLADAEAEYAEALAIWRHLVAENARAYEAYMGETLCEWALLKKEQNDRDRMRALAREAVEVFKRCDERTSGMYAAKVRWAEGILEGNAAGAVQKPD